MTRRWTWLAPALIGSLLACESDKASSGSSATSDTTLTSDTPAGDDSDSAVASADSDGPGASDADEADAAAPGADAAAEADAATEPTGDGPPAPKAYSGGTCPTFAAGAGKFASGGLDRDLVVTLPAKPEGAGVVFLWHGFGDTASNFSAAVGAKMMSKNENVITITPLAVIDPLSSEKLTPYKDLAAQFIGPLPPTWSVLDGPEPDLGLFDDLLACLDQQFKIDRKRVYSFGFSQGALFTVRLVLERSDVLASAVMWSGGLGSSGGLIELVRFTYKTPARRVPVITAAGGTTDLWPNEQLPLVNFQTGTDELSKALLTDGHATITCNHGLGHTIPQDGLSWALPFMFDHEWTKDGASKYFGDDGSAFPPYCTMPPAQP